MLVGSTQFPFGFGRLSVPGACGIRRVFSERTIGGIAIMLDLHPPVHRSEVDAAMNGHVLAQAELVGTYGR